MALGGNPGAIVQFGGAPRAWIQNGTNFRLSTFDFRPRPPPPSYSRSSASRAILSYASTAATSSATTTCSSGVCATWMEPGPKR